MPTFGPTKKVAKIDGKEVDLGKYYESIPAHGKNAQRKGRENKSFWSISANKQYECFEKSDMNDWWDAEKNGYYFINPSLDPIGKTDEIRAFFPNPDNNSEFPCFGINYKWHGYPTKDRRVSNDLIELWIEKGVITRATGLNIKRLKL